LNNINFNHMKKLLFLVTAVTFSLAGLAQGKSQSKGKANNKGQPGAAKVKTSPGQGQGTSGGNGKADAQFNQRVWAGTNDGNGGKGPLPSKNQPAKVREAFYRDYPNAGNVVWSKYRGDWTATFGSGMFGSRTAVYHANGQRKDTRSVINNDQLPGGGTVWDRIFKRDRITPANEVVQVERPGIIDRIFRVGSLGNTTARYLFYNANGQQVQYDY
jgi:hypothetical protein